MKKIMSSLTSRIIYSIAIGFTLTQLHGLSDVAFAQSIYFDDADSKIMKLGNSSHYEVGFRKTNGSIAYILDKATGDSLTAGSRFEKLWIAAFRNEGWTYIDGSLYDEAGLNKFSYDWDNAKKKLTLSYTPGSSNSTKVTASVKVKPYEGYYFDASITVNHNFGVPLEAVFFPAEMVFKESKIEEALLPVIPGVILEKSFFMQGRSYSTNYPGWPGVFADLVSIKLQNSSFAAYSIYDTARPIPVVRIGFGHDDGYVASSTFSRHIYRMYVSDGQEWASPTVRIHLGQSHKTVIEQFRQDNQIDQYLSVAEKLGDRFHRVSKSPFLNVDFQIQFTEYDRILALLPSPAIIHPPVYYAGGFDHNYPDFFPPDPQYGTAEELRALFKRAQARGIMVMPYTNPTWWDDDSPTVQNELPPSTINDIAVIEKNGQPRIEVYDNNDGIVVSPWHPFVIQRIDRLIKEMTEDLPSDFIYEDQIGARGGLLDLNPNAAVPWAYLQGWFEHTKKHAHIGLGTETGYDRLLETEIFFRKYALT